MQNSINKIPTQLVLPLINKISFRKDGTPLHSHLHDDPEACRVPYLYQDLRKDYINRFNLIKETFSPLASIPFREIQRLEMQIIYSDQYGVKSSKWFAGSLLNVRMRSYKHFNFHIHVIKSRTITYEASLDSTNQVQTEVLNTVYH